MPHFLRLATALLGLVCLGARLALAQDSTLTRLARQHQYVLQASGTQFSGMG